MHLTVITMLVDCRLNRIISRFFFTERTSEILILAINNQKIAMQSIVEIIVEKLPLQSTPESFLLSATKAVLERNHVDGYGSGTDVWSAETRAEILSAMYKRHGSLHDFVISTCAGVDTTADAFNDMPFAFTGNMDDCISVAVVNETVDFKRHGGKTRVKAELQSRGAIVKKGRGGKYFWHGLQVKPVSTPADDAVDMETGRQALQRTLSELQSQIAEKQQQLAELRVREAAAIKQTSTRNTCAELPKKQYDDWRLSESEDESD